MSAVPEREGGLIDVLVTHPHFWPYVRRGAEREAHDIAVGLRRRGHRVRLLTGAPEGPPVARRRVDGVPVTYLRAMTPRRLERRGWTPETAWAVTAGLPLAVDRAELIHALHYAEAWVAKRVRRSRPLVLKLTGTVVPERLHAVGGPDARAFLGALDSADEVWCNSGFARESMAEFGREMRVVPAGIDLTTFRRRGPRADWPLVACAASPDEPRKRAVDVVAAWPAVVEELPGARLVLAGAAGRDTIESLTARLPPALRDTVTFAGTLDEEPLRVLYEQAHATVAPARFEALGLATLESLAVGTPVAGARSGATPELIPPGVGALFDPGDAQGCAAAVVAAVRLASAEGIEDRCRDAVAAYGWDALWPLISARHEAIAGHA